MTELHTLPDAVSVEPTLAAPGGFSLVEVVVAMVMVAVVISSLGMLTAKTAQRSIDLANGTARQAFTLQEVNRMAALPYDSIPGKVGCDTVATGILRYRRCMTYTSGTRYRELTIIVRPLKAGTYNDTVVIRRVTNTTNNPLFMP